MQIDERLWIECQQVFPTTVPPVLPYLCGIIDHNIKVSLVDGDVIRLWSRKGRAKSNRGDDDFLDFVDAGNGEEDPGLCPKDEIYVDAKVSSDNWAFNCFHEAVERRYMADGMKYEKAHEHANEVERVVRMRAAEKNGHKQMSLLNEFKQFAQLGELRCSDTELAAALSMAIAESKLSAVGTQSSIKQVNGFLTGDLNGKQVHVHADGDWVLKPDNRITRDAFLYMEPKDESQEESFGQCGSCGLHTGQTCMILGSDLRITPSMSCSLYINGIPNPGNLGKEQCKYTPQEVGLVNNQVRCENCVHSRENGTVCYLFMELQEHLPKLYRLDPVIKPKGCCNAFTPTGTATAEFSQHRLAMNYDDAVKTVQGLRLSDERKKHMLDKLERNKNYSSVLQDIVDDGKAREFLAAEKAKKANKQAVAERAEEKSSPAANAADKVRGLLDEVNSGNVTTERVNTLMESLKKELKQPELEQLLTSLKISGKPKSKEHAIESIKQVLNSQVEMYVKGQAYAKPQAMSPSSQKRPEEIRAEKEKQAGKTRVSPAEPDPEVLHEQPALPGINLPPKDVTQQGKLFETGEGTKPDAPKPTEYHPEQKSFLEEKPAEPAKVEGQQETPKAAEAANVTPVAAPADDWRKKYAEGDKYRIPIEELQSDPERFQFRKMNVGKHGGTGRLKDAKVWEDTEPLQVWRDPQDHKIYVVDGHNRKQRAHEFHEEGNPTAPKSLEVSFIDAPDAQTAKTEGALKNMRAGNASPLEAGLWLKDTGKQIADLEQRGVAVRRAEDAMSIARLSDRVLGAAQAGVLDEKQAVGIGKHLPNHSHQNALYSLIRNQENKQNRKLSGDQVSSMAKDFRNMPEGVKKDTQGQLWSDLNDPAADVWAKKHEILSDLRKSLGKKKDLNQAIGSQKNQAVLEESGHEINPEQAQKAATDAEKQLQWLGDEFTTRKGTAINEALNKAAKEIHDNPERQADILGQLKSNLPSILQETERGGVGQHEPESEGLAPGDAGDLQRPTGEGQETPGGAGEEGKRVEQPVGEAEKKQREEANANAGGTPASAPAAIAQKTTPDAGQKPGAPRKGKLDRYEHRSVGKGKEKRHLVYDTESGQESTEHGSSGEARSFAKRLNVEPERAEEHIKQHKSLWEGPQQTPPQGQPAQKTAPDAGGRPQQPAGPAGQQPAGPGKPPSGQPSQGPQGGSADWQRGQTKDGKTKWVLHDAQGKFLEERIQENKPGSHGGKQEQPGQQGKAGPEPAKPAKEGGLAGHERFDNWEPEEHHRKAKTYAGQAAEYGAQVEKAKNDKDKQKAQDKQNQKARLQDYHQQLGDYKMGLTDQPPEPLPPPESEVHQKASQAAKQISDRANQVTNDIPDAVAGRADKALNSHADAIESGFGAHHLLTVLALAIVAGAGMRLLRRHPIAGAAILIGLAALYMRKRKENPDYEPSTEDPASEQQNQQSAEVVQKAAVESMPEAERDAVQKEIEAENPKPPAKESPSGAELLANWAAGGRQQPFSPKYKAQVSSKSQVAETAQQAKEGLRARVSAGKKSRGGKAIHELSQRKRLKRLSKRVDELSMEVQKPRKRRRAVINIKQESPELAAVAKQLGNLAEVMAAKQKAPVVKKKTVKRDSQGLITETVEEEI